MIHMKILLKFGCKLKLKLIFLKLLSIVWLTSLNNV